MRAIPDPGFPGDDGSASAALAAALASYDPDDAASYGATLAVLQHERLLVPVVAVLGEVGYDDLGRPREKTSDMATVLLRGRDGRTALLAFTGTESLRRWRPDARPVPVTVAAAAEAALQDGAEALVVDVAGPTMFVVETDDLRELAQRHTLVPVAGTVSGRYGWVRPGP